MNPISLRRKPFAALSALTALTVFGIATPITLMPAPAYAQAEEIEPAERSNLSSLRLPKGTLRSTNKEHLEKFASALKTAAEANHGSMAKIEVLIWTSEDADHAKKDLPKRLKEAGYSYAASDAFDSEVGKVTPFASKREGEKNGLMGMWIDTEDGISLVCWGQFTPDSSAANRGEERKEGDSSLGTTEEESVEADTPVVREILPTSVTKPAAAKPVVNGKVPPEMLGAWSWTTISGVNYRNSTTGQLASPSGMSAKFTFLPNGRYKFFFYVTQRTYNLVTQSTTNAEGTVEFRNDGTFIVRPTRGHYKGNTGSRIIDRPMTAAERKPVTWYWEWRVEDGKRFLYIGPAKGSMSRFKSEK